MTFWIILMAIAAVCVIYVFAWRLLKSAADYDAAMPETGPCEVFRRELADRERIRHEDL